MSIPLFFNTVTTFVSAQFVMISEFFIASKIKYFSPPLQPLFGHLSSTSFVQKFLSKRLFFKFGSRW